MNNAIVISQVLGFLFTILGLSVIIHKKNTAAALDLIIGNQGFLWLWGFVALAIGAVIVAFNSTWTYGWQLVIAILGWVAILKGTFIIIFPKSTASFYKKMNKDGILAIGGFVLFFLGLIMLYAGFF